MKKLILALAAMFTLTISAHAMSYEQARQQALFLADKMAYELNLTEEQYEAVYEINLDYLMSINTHDDLYGAYWRQRNLDLSYILLDWQYRAYCAANYFYRPLYWDAGYWHFSVYARYPHRNYFYFGRPAFWTVYRGGHSWRMNGGRSWYHGRDFRPRGDRHNNGMRDRFDRGDYKKHGNTGRDMRPNNGGFGNNRNIGRGQNNGRFGTNNNNGIRQTERNTPQNNDRNIERNGNRNTERNMDRTNSNNRNSGFGRPATPNGRESSTRTTVRNNENSGFGGSRSGSFRERSTPAPNNRSTMTPSNNRRSFSSGSQPSNSRSSFGGSSHSSGSRNSFGSGSAGSRSSHPSGGSRSGSGGGHFGGRR